MNLQEQQDLKATLDIINRIDNMLRAEFKDPIRRVSYLNENLPKLMNSYGSNLSCMTDLKLFRGFASELVMTYILEIIRSQCRVLIKEGLIIPTEEGTTQLDHLILTPTHGAIIEVKHVYGDLYINGTEMIVRNDFETRKMMPWNQNLYHIYKLKEYLNLTNLFFYNIVFIYGDYRIKEFSPSDGNYLLEYNQSVKNLKAMINSEPPFKPNISDVNMAVAKINSLPKLSIFEHIKRVERV